MKLGRFWILLIVCWFAVTKGFPQSSTNIGTIYGEVLAGGSALSGVHVRLESEILASLSATTSADGSFRFANLPPGSYSLSFFHQGYLPVQRKGIAVSIGERVKLNVILEPASDITGVVYGTVTDKNGIPLEGVRITLESDIVPPLQATSRSDGSFRFENLPAGKYLVQFKKKGYLEWKQEQIELPVGSAMQVNPQLETKARTEPEEAAGSIERRSTGISWNYSRDFLRMLPKGGSVYAILDHTLAVDSDTFSTAYSDPGLGGANEFATVISRGSDNYATVWNYDGLNLNVHGLKGLFPSFFDLQHVEQVQIITAANDVSIPTGGVIVNIVSKQGGTKWHGTGSFFYSDHNLQSNNTPEEVKNDSRIERPPTHLIDNLQEFDFDLGGPIIPDKLFIWGAVHQGWLDRFDLVLNEPEKNKYTSYSMKANLNLSPAHQFQFGYFRADGCYSRDFFDVREEKLLKPTTILPGIWSAQHSWIPDDNTLVRARYGYIGAGIRDTFMPLDAPFHGGTSERTVHDVHVELNRLTENLLWGDHDFRFGFEYRTSLLRELFFADPPFDPPFSYEDESPNPDGPLTEGMIIVNYPDSPFDATIVRTSLYVADSYHHGRLTLDLGLRFDRQAGRNEARTTPSPLDVYGRPDFLGPGFEELIRPIDYPGKDTGIFDNLSPRIGATYDWAGNAGILIFGSFARYYQPYQGSLLGFSAVGGGLTPGFDAFYKNLNNDRVITPDEIVDSGIFNYEEALSQKLYDSRLSNRFVNEYVLGAQTQLWQEFLVAAAFVHRSYHVFHVEFPFPFAVDYQLTGTTELHTTLGDFVIPLFSASSGLPDRGTAIIRNNNAYQQTYDGLDLRIQKEMSKNFMFTGGLVLQRQRAHGYSEDFAPEFFFPASTGKELNPTVNYAVLENHSYWIFSKDKQLAPSEWQLKFSGAYRFPWNLDLGAFFRYQQGYPFVLVGLQQPPAIGSFFWVEPFENRRLDNIMTLDMKLDKEFSLQRYGRINLILEIFNVTNANPVTSRVGFIGVTDGSLYDPNPDLNKVLLFMSPRVMRLGLRYSF